MAFLHPSFLFALIAIGIPIVLHLIQLRKAKRIVFSNLKFIQQSKDITASQRNIKEWLILLCRILFILFLVFAFAQPFIPANNNATNTDTSEVKLILDNSYSMQQVKPDNDQTLFEAGNELAKTIIELFPHSTSFSINTNGDFSKDQLQKLEVVDQLEKLSFSGNTSTGYLNDIEPSSHIFFLSDFQRSNFKPSVFSQIDSSTQVHLLPIEGAENKNIVVDSVFLEDEFIRTQAENILHVILRNDGSGNAEDVPVKFFIGKAQVAVLSIDIAAKQKKEATINFRLTDTNSQAASISIEDYPVNFENTYFFNLKPSAPITIVSIADDASHALASLYKAEPFFRYFAYTSDQVDYSKVALADIIILRSINSLSTGIAATVANYVQDGGTLVVIPPAGVNPEGYTSFFQNLSIAAGLQTASLQSPKIRLLAPDPANVFFRSIFSNFDPKMQMPEAVRTVSWSQSSEDILKYRGGTPFLSRFDRGDGQVYLMAAPLEQEYNTLVNHAFFVPLFYKMALSSYKQEQQLAYTLGKGTISVPVNNTTRREGIYELKKDTLTFIPEQQVRGSKLYFTLPSALAEAGFYTLALRDSVVATLAFNYDRAESDLAQYSPDELRAMVSTKYKNVHVYNYSDTFTVKGEFEKRYFGVKLWKYCLILCLFFLMAEIALIRLL